MHIYSTIYTSPIHTCKEAVCVCVGWGGRAVLRFYASQFAIQKLVKRNHQKAF